MWCSGLRPKPFLHQRFERHQRGQGFTLGPGLAFDAFFKDMGSFCGFPFSSFVAVHFLCFCCLCGRVVLFLFDSVFVAVVAAPTSPAPACFS